MIIIWFLVSQTVIPDFQVNSEDYPGITPQLFPSIAGHDSGGAIIWYDLRVPTFGLQIWGSLINISGDTINKNFRLNDDTTTGCMSQPVIDNDTNGNFVIAYIQRQNVQARRFNKSGVPYGPSFTANTSSGCQFPSIAVSPSGRFVIVWLKSSENRFYGQVFDANGNPVGTNFVVSDSAIPLVRDNPGIGIKDIGDFIIAWHYKDEIWAQLFDSLGNRIGENFKLVNDTISTKENYPRLQFDIHNNLFVSWTASVQGQNDINCQIFDSTLTPITNIIKLDGNDVDTAQYQAFAIKDSIWFVAFQNGINKVYLQRIKNNGEIIGSNILINEPLGQRNSSPKIDLTEQYFIITWSRKLAGSIYDIMCQKVSFNGNLIGNNYVISDDKGGAAQVLSNVAADNNGNFFVVWTDDRKYPDYYYVPNCYGKRYDHQGNPYGDEFRINTYANADYSTIGINSNIYVVVWARTQPDSNHQIYAQRFDLNGNPIGTNYQVSLSSGMNQLSFPKITTLSNNYFVVIWNENIGTIDKIYGRILDSMGIPYGIQFNPYVDSSGYNWGWSAVDEENGKFIVPIVCGISDSVVIALKEFDYNGNPISEPKILNESPASHNFVCGAKGIDRYLFIWNNAAQKKIIGQFLDNNLQKIGSNFSISDDTIAFKTYYSLVSSNDGKFFVLWDEQRDGNFDLYGQFYDSQGNRIGDNFRVDNDTTNGEQRLPSCFTANNRIYVVWDDTRTLVQWYDVYCKVIQWPDGVSIQERETENNQLSLTVRPKIFKNHLWIRYQLPEARCLIDNEGQGFSLTIYDVAGRLVRQWNYENIKRADHIVWDANDNAGRKLPAGIYFICLGFNNDKKIAKVIMLR